MNLIPHDEWDALKLDIKNDVNLYEQKTNQTWDAFAGMTNSASAVAFSGTDPTMSNIMTINAMQNNLSAWDDPHIDADSVKGMPKSCITVNPESYQGYIRKELYPSIAV